MKTPTIYDVAAHAGVSKSLVSLVLRGSPRVSDEKREAVQRAVDELGYTPSRLAAGLAGSRTRSVGVVIDEFENLWFAPALAGLRSALAEGRYSLSVADTALNAHLGIDPLEAFRALRVDGVVLAGEVSEASLARLGIPAVVLGTRSFAAGGAPVIASDEVAGGRLATAHLIGLGHRDIACVTAPGASASARETGYVAEMRAHGLEPRIVRSVQTSEVAARIAASAMFDSAASGGSGVSAGGGPAGGGIPTAIFAVNDPMAVGVIGAAAERGIAVPEQLSVVGYDDSPLAAYEFLSLTTVSGDPRELGEEAGRALVELMEAEAGSAPPSAPATARLLPPRLMTRASTAAPAPTHS
ncbi:LacI family DNA-binding transcriptional regulator [Leucobacter luti]|uniref:LacI family DNA-binding transcriptional regulator n=1 Tax=Leucobacter luti TaxID=340320 RepID=UPI003D05F015